MFFLSSKQRGADLFSMLLAVVFANMNPVFSKSLLLSGWNPLQLYIAILLIICGFMGVYELIALEHGERWGMTKEDVLGTILTALTGGTLSPLLFFYGLQTTGASESLIITSLMPFLVVCFAVLFLKERFTTQIVTGGAFLIAGLVALLWNDIINATFRPGALLILASAVCSALTAILHKKYVRHRHLDSIVLVRSLLSLLFVGLWMLLFDPQPYGFLFVPQNVWAFLTVPIGCFLVPFFLYFRALDRLTALDAGMLEALGRVIGITAATSILGEHLLPRHFVSILLSMFGIVLVSVPLTKWKIVPSRLLMQGPLRK